VRATSLGEAARFPVTVMTAAVSIGITLAFWSGGDVSLVMMDPVTFHGEPWRVVTSIFPHGHVPHLLFNIMWLWIFGTYIERAFGHVATVALIIALAAVSSTAQYAVSAGGIGLSGVGYGMLGFLWATARLDRRYSDAMDDRTMKLFLIWGGLCIVLTALGIWRIANMAHAAGLVAGVLLGGTRAGAPGRRPLAAMFLMALTSAALLGATTLRPRTALFDRGAIGLCYSGWQALGSDDDALALALLEDAAGYPEVSAGCRFNYGIALSRAGRVGESATVFERAVAEDPSLAKGAVQSAPLTHDP